MSRSIAALFQRLTQGVYVVGVAHGAVRNAFTAAWVMQVSFDPLLLTLSINPHHSSYRLLKESRASASTC
jgi:flavin reductase (DIM6/NTAB) family NADH-FMN oxidoreductase RutF